MLDYDERRIEDAFKPFSQLAVDTAKIERNVKIKMNEKKYTPSPRNKVKAILAASIAAMILMAGTVMAAELGLFERFMTQHDPYFREVVSPVEQSAVVDGIYTSIIAAQKFGNQAIVYLSMRDVSSEDRICEEAYFVLDNTFGVSQLIYFDEDSRTAYFEIAITVTNPQDYLDLNNIILSLGGWPDFIEALPMQLQTNAETRPTDGAFLSDLPMDTMLQPALAGNFAPLPITHSYQWVSGMAIVGDYLHVQIGERVYPRTVGRGGVGAPVLTTQAGEDITGRYLVMHTCDDFQPVDIRQGHMPNLLFREYVFRVNANDIENYSLAIVGTTPSTITEMDLGIRIYDGESTQLRILDSAPMLEEAAIDSISLTPLGVRLTGQLSYDAKYSFLWSGFVESGVVLETTEGNVYLDHIINMIDTYPNATFNSIAKTTSPINVDTVVAVIIGGVRIEL